MCVLHAYVIQGKGAAAEPKHDDDRVEALAVRPLALLSVVVDQMPGRGGGSNQVSGKTARVDAKAHAKPCV